MSSLLEIGATLKAARNQGGENLVDVQTVLFPSHRERLKNGPYRSTSDTFSCSSSSSLLSPSLRNPSPGILSSQETSQSNAHDTGLASTAPSPQGGSSSTKAILEERKELSERIDSASNVTDGKASFSSSSLPVKKEERYQQRPQSSVALQRGGEGREIDKELQEVDFSTLREGEDGGENEADHLREEKLVKTKRNKDRKNKKKDRDESIFPPSVFEDFNRSLSAIFKEEYGGGSMTFGGRDQVERVTAKATTVYLHTVAKRLGAITPLLGSLLTRRAYEVAAQNDLELDKKMTKEVCPYCGCLRIPLLTATSHVVSTSLLGKAKRRRINRAMRKAFLHEIASTTPDSNFSSLSKRPSSLSSSSMVSSGSSFSARSLARMTASSSLSASLLSSFSSSSRGDPSLPSNALAQARSRCVKNHLVTICHLCQQATTSVGCIDTPSVSSSSSCTQTTAPADHPHSRTVKKRRISSSYTSIFNRRKKRRLQNEEKEREQIAQLSAVPPPPSGVSFSPPSLKEIHAPSHATPPTASSFSSSSFDAGLIPAKWTERGLSQNRKNSLVSSADILLPPVPKILPAQHQRQGRYFSSISSTPPSNLMSRGDAIHVPATASMSSQQTAGAKRRRRGKAQSLEDLARMSLTSGFSSSPPQLQRDMKPLSQSIKKPQAASARYPQSCQSNIRPLPPSMLASSGVAVSSTISTRREHLQISSQGVLQEGKRKSNDTSACVGQQSNLQSSSSSSFSVCGSSHASLSRIPVEKESAGQESGDTLQQSSSSTPSHMNASTYQRRPPVLPAEASREDNDQIIGRQATISPVSPLGESYEERQAIYGGTHARTSEGLQHLTTGMEGGDKKRPLDWRVNRNNREEDNGERGLIDLDGCQTQSSPRDSSSFSSIPKTFSNSKPQESFQEKLQKDTGEMKEPEKLNRTETVGNKKGTVGMPGVDQNEGSKMPSMYDLLQQFTSQGTDESDIF
ncbi:rnase p rpr2 rpp21 subunit domain-containing protein [Cystoisospora suis]|uniref:Rnase p rpr2 rpp21 subunit domain-containing protein n=1 Tax=Cystoisospora suis TaxID=483139 RepID=A0A2C6KWF6_9APIC|nr:rnase p rpr2 rpp21 subunit domain-containing protein [Cystoisospora suis]